MSSGFEVDVDLKISKRMYLISNLENIIRESVYYRNHSHEFSDSGKIDISIFDAKNIKKKIL